MIRSKDTFSKCDLIKFELTLMEEVKAPSLVAEKHTAEFKSLVPSTDFVGAPLEQFQPGNSFSTSVLANR